MPTVFALFRWLNPFRWIGRLWLIQGNLRRMLTRRLDFLLLEVPPTLMPVPQDRNILMRLAMGQPKPSLWEIDQNFRRIARDSRVKGVILSFRKLDMPMADLLSFRASIARLRAAGKRVIAYANGYDTRTYFVACACDEVYVAPWGPLDITGLYLAVPYLQRSLQQIGIAADVVQITPYKLGLETFAQDEMSDAMRETVTRLLDSQYANLVEGIAASRNLSEARVRELIDSAPHYGTAGVALGLIEGVASQEALLERLETRHVIAWEKGTRKLQKRPTPPGKVVAILHVQGMMVEGESRTPPGDFNIPMLTDARMGHLTVVKQVRNLMDDARVGAVVLHIDSGGGNSEAAVPMMRALSALNEKKPLVIYMNSTAASGGYAIAVPGRWIVAQPGTITGSIGVFAFKFVVREAWEKIQARTYEFRRGDNADIFLNASAWTEDQQAAVRDQIVKTYEDFIAEVAAGRNMSTEAVDAVGGGRVWTGRQAIDNGLIDALGDVHAAIEKARELAELPPTTPTRIAGTTSLRPLGPMAADEAAATVATLLYAREAVALLGRGPQLRAPYFELR